MANAAIIAAAGMLPIPGASIVAGAYASGALTQLVTVIDPGKARDAARINRRDFFLNAAKAGSVIACRYLLAGENNVYTDKEKGQYRDGVKEMQSRAPDVLSQARAIGPLWDQDVGNGNLLPAGQAIGQELGKIMNVPEGVANVNQVGAIQAWASQFGYAIRRDTAQAVAQATAGAGAAIASAVAPSGSKEAGSVLIPTNKSTLAIVALVIVLGLAFFVMRKG